MLYFRSLHNGYDQAVYNEADTTWRMDPIKLAQNDFGDKLKYIDIIPVVGKMKTIKLLSYWEVSGLEQVQI